jgi:hypothetical protein
MVPQSHRSRVSLAALLALPWLVAFPAGAQDGTTLDDAVYARVNQIRQSFGLSLLARNAQLERAAQLHAEDMARNRFMGHFGSNGSSPASRIRAAGYVPTWWAENVAYGYRSADAVMNAWMNSPGHRANLLSGRVREIGIGVAVSSTGQLYWCQDFGNRAGAITPTTPDLDDPGGGTDEPQVELVSRDVGPSGTRIVITGQRLGRSTCLIFLGVSGHAQIESWTEERIALWLTSVVPGDGSIRVCGPGDGSGPVLYLVWG